jgi:hypothetical protein
MPQLPAAVDNVCHFLPASVYYTSGSCFAVFAVHHTLHGSDAYKGRGRVRLKLHLLWKLTSAYCSMCKCELSAIKHTTRTFRSCSPLFPPRCMSRVCYRTCYVLSTRTTYNTVRRHTQRLQILLCICILPLFRRTNVAVAVFTEITDESRGLQSRV